MNEDELWKQIEKEADYVGSTAAHNSDVFSLLATILAYYQSRGTLPEQMISSETMKAAINNLLATPTEARR